MNRQETEEPIGLSEAEARRRLEAEGPNEIRQGRRRSVWRIIGEVVREPMLALLLAGGAIYLLLGDPTEAAMLLAFAGLSIMITVVQETRTERVLETLRDLTSPRALVIRGGERKRIAGRDVVRGDIVVLSEGDRTPADARLLNSSYLEADESLLSGESVPVVKEGLDNIVYSGSLIVRGSAVAEVIATGPASEIGKIGASLHELEFEPPRMQAEMRRLVGLFGVLGFSASILAILLYGLLRGGWLDALLAGIALGMSMLPEEFPVVLTVFMAMGAWRISRARVLTRKAAAIESLGAATVLCTDKTGTLTENSMRVKTLVSRSGDVAPANNGVAFAGEEFSALIEYAQLASAPDKIDPMEKAFHRLAEENWGDRTHIMLARSYGLESGLLAVTNVWRDDEGAVIAAAKGAPESIADLCKMGAGEKAQIMQAADALAQDGLRVIAVARATHSGRLPDSPREFAFEFLGMAGLADPIRKSAAAAVAECRSAGVRVIMITGDYPTTAKAIARQAGIDGDVVMSGDEIASLSDQALAEAVRNITVFARVRPEQKLRIVRALKEDGEIVAMTGDGVNDAPALKAAHIGVAMGGRGTDVAREAAAIVLLDDDFSAIVRTIRLGRRIHDNLRKATSFILSVHLPIAGMALLPLAFGLPIVFGPVHIAFLEMIVDPACSLVLEAEKEEQNVMRRPPRSPREPLLTRRLALWSVLEGLVAMAAVVGVYFLAINSGAGDMTVRAMAFIAVVSAVFALILVNRTYSASVFRAVLAPNIALAGVSAFVAILLSAVFLFEGGRELFRFGSLTTAQIAISVAAGATTLGFLELLKAIFSRRAP